jgi:ferric-dicitrate binding protein FerR (iron transport regulator)
MKFNEAHILAYIKRELPADDIKECDAFMQSSPEFAETVKQLRYIYDLSEDLRKQKDIDTISAWNKVSRKIIFSSFRQKMWHITRTAAAILFPLFLLYQYAVIPALENKPSEMITLTSAPGIVTEVVLPDGSKVWLNAQSKLTYPVQFKDKERSVQLLGEAYFSVVADKKNRFNVITPNDITISAYGTEFNVNAYQDEPDYSITLVKGHIEVATANIAKKKELEAGQKIILNSKTGKPIIVEADTYVETAWKDGKMVFRREKLETFAQKLSRKFGVVVQLEDNALKEYEYTATFTDETLEDILDLLKRSSPITYTITKQERQDNNTYTQKIVTIKNKRDRTSVK